MQFRFDFGNKYDLDAKVVSISTKMTIEVHLPNKISQIFRIKLVFPVPCKEPVNQCMGWDYTRGDASSGWAKEG